MADLAAKLASKRRRRIDRSLLYKKLHGRVGMSTREAEDIIDTIRDEDDAVALAWPQKSAA